MHLETHDLTKRFGDVVAVDHASLAVAKGEFVTLLGPSGCGKTTLLRLVAGLETPDGGRLLLDGRDLTPVPAAARRFGFVFQAYALFPTKTVADNVAFPLRLQGVPPAERRRRVGDLAELLHVEDLLQRFPHELSGGQQQRVALARALAMQPDLLLLDEPLSALDARIRQHLRRELRQSVRTVGVTALYVTHDQEEALELSDRIVVMDRGRIVQAGAPQDVYLRPADAQVAAFLGRATLIPVVAATDGSLVPQAGPPITGVAHDLAGGRRGHLCIRPEFARLACASAAPFRGTVRDCSFSGALVRVTVAGPWPEPVDVDVPYVAWRASGFAVGGEVGLGFANDHLVVLADGRA
jgi:putative spermidine/putrescine transport system ATP-binding protein